MIERELKIVKTKKLFDFSIDVQSRHSNWNKEMRAPSYMFSVPAFIVLHVISCFQFCNRFNSTCKHLLNICGNFVFKIISWKLQRKILCLIMNEVINYPLVLIVARQL